MKTGCRGGIGKNCQKENEEFVKSITCVRELLRQNEQKKLECLKKIANNAKNAIAYLWDIEYNLFKLYKICGDSFGIFRLYL